MSALADVQTEYQHALQDSDGIIEAIDTGATKVRDSSIQNAVDRYSERVKYIVTQLYTVLSTTGYYALPSVVDPQGFTIPFVLPFSRIIQIEVPIDNTPPTYLPFNSWNFQFKENNIRLLYINTVPVTPFRITYLARHAYETVFGKGTWDPAHSRPIGKLAAAMSAEFAADFYAHGIQSNNDGVNWKAKSDEWKDRAKLLRAEVDRELRSIEISQNRYISSMVAAKARLW